MSSAITQKTSQRPLRIFCPTHKVSFSVSGSNKILCDVGGHALAENFPFSDSWGYCCDCQSFWPLSVAAEAGAAHVCVSCERAFTRVYVCDNCRVVSFESDEPAPRKEYRLPDLAGPQPSCPGCSTNPGAAPRTHDCAVLGTSFMTARAVCPFCDDKIAAPIVFEANVIGSAGVRVADTATVIDADPLDFDETTQVSPRPAYSDVAEDPLPSASSVCVRCGATGKETDAFCQTCGARRGAGQESNSWDADQADTEAGQMVTTSTSPASRGYLKGGIVVGLIVIAVLIVAAVLRFSGLRSVEGRLDDAIAQGSLVAPTGACAYDFYHQLKREGASADTLARYDAKLLPLLTTHPKQMLTEIAEPERNNEPPTAQWDEAAKLLSWASEIKPQETSLAARSLYCTGRVAYLNKNKDEAKRNWKRAGDLDQTWALPLNHIGLVYNEQRDYEGARPFLYEAIKREPQWAVPYNNLGTSFYYKQDYVQAESYYEKARDRAPRWARPHAWLGDIAMRRGDYARAAEEFETVLNLANAENSSIKLEDIRKKLDEAHLKSNQSVVE